MMPGIFKTKVCFVGFIIICFHEHLVLSNFDVIETQLTWEQALLNCSSNGMVVIEKETSLKSLCNMIKAKYDIVQTPRFWIGLRWISSMQGYQWNSNKTLTYNLTWAPGEPDCQEGKDNCNQQQNCVLVNKKNDTCEYRSADCEEKLAWAVCLGVTIAETIGTMNLNSTGTSGKIESSTAASESSQMATTSISSTLRTTDGNSESMGSSFAVSVTTLQTNTKTSTSTSTIVKTDENSEWTSTPPFVSAFQIETGTKSSILTTTTRGETEANSQSSSTSTSASDSSPMMSTSITSTFDGSSESHGSSAVPETTTQTSLMVSTSTTSTLGNTDGNSKWTSTQPFVSDNGNHLTTEAKEGFRAIVHCPSGLDSLCDCVVVKNVSSVVNDETIVVKVDKTKTSAYIRRHRSAYDDRFSAKVLGYSGMGVLIGVLVLIVCMDLTRLQTNTRPSRRRFT